MTSYSIFHFQLEYFQDLWKALKIPFHKLVVNLGHLSLHIKSNYNFRHLVDELKLLRQFFKMTFQFKHLKKCWLMDVKLLLIVFSKTQILHKLSKCMCFYIKQKINNYSLIHFIHEIKREPSSVLVVL